MSEFLTLGRNEGYEGCDDEGQQELIEMLKQREGDTSSVTASPRHLPLEGKA